MVTLAAVYADQAMGFSPDETILLVLLVNITAAIGAFAFGYVEDRIGHKNALIVTLFIWIAMVGVAYFAQTKALFGWLRTWLVLQWDQASQQVVLWLVFWLLKKTARHFIHFGIWRCG